MSFESPEWVRVSCTVRSGSGTRAGSKKQVLDDRHQEKHRVIKELTGTGSMPGSLNLHPQSRLWLRRSKAIDSPIGPLFSARLRGIPVVFRPWPPEIQIGAPPRRLLVYSDRHLRDALGLVDGDSVELDLPRRTLLGLAPLNKLVYAIRRLMRISTTFPRSRANRNSAPP